MSMSMSRYPLLSSALTPGLLCAVVWLAGCSSVAPPSTVQPLAERAGVGQKLTPAAAAAGLHMGVPSRAWWQDLDDGALNEVMRQAMAQNHELQAALSSVKEARALAGLAQRDNLPQGSATLQLQQLQLSQPEVDPYRQGLERVPAQELLTVGPVVSWEIDLFGRVGTASAMAQRQWDAARADVHAATALLQAEVVRQYVRLRQHQATLPVLQEEQLSARERVQQLQKRADAGLADQRDVMAAQTELARLHAQHVQLEATVHQTKSALAVLAGRSPTQTDAAWAALLAPAAMPALPSSLRLKQPSDLLANRPDVAKADAMLRMSMGNAVLAERAHLPRLSLNLAANLNERMSSLGTPGAAHHSVGALLQWDWLSFGRIQARAAAAQAGSERAMHQLEQTVLKALEDSEGALRNWVAAQQAWQQADRALQLASEANAYTQHRVQAGLEPQIQGLSQQAQLQQARRNTAEAQANQLAAYAQVQLALGAWQPLDEEH